MLKLSEIPELAPFSWSAMDLSPWASYLSYYDIYLSASVPDVCEQQQLGMMNLGGFDIAVHYFQAQDAKGSVVLNHGYMDHVGLYGHAIRALLAAGYNVLAYDLPGHGLSSGDSAGISNFYYYQKVLSALLTQAQQQLAKPWYAVGQSTGAAITMDYMLKNPEHGFSKQVLLAPLVIPKRWKMIKGLLVIGRYILSSVPRGFPANSSDEQFLHFLKHEDPLQTRKISASWVNALDRWQAEFHASKASDIETLIIQGKADVTVEWSYNLPAIKQRFHKVKEVVLLRANHHLVNESEAIRERVLTEMTAFIAL